LLCRSGDTVVDIGANVGSHTLSMARLVGETGRTYAFEPVPWAVNKLKRNLALNKFKNIKVEQVALSDENHERVEMKFRASFKIEAAQGVDKHGRIEQDWWQECEKVVTKMQTLDSYARENKLARVDLIKLDVDGFEGKVIRGASNVLKQHRPILIMEIAPAWVSMRGDSVSEIVKQLKEIGYRCFAEVTFDEFLDFKRMIDEIPKDGGINVVFASAKPVAKNIM
jgi:FkbM family methyltransferase